MGQWYRVVEKINGKDGNCPRVVSETDDSVADFARSEKCDANKDFRSMEKDGTNEKSKSHAFKANPCCGELKERKAVSRSDHGVFPDIAPATIKKSKNIFRVTTILIVTRFQLTKPTSYLDLRWWKISLKVFRLKQLRSS